MSEDIIVKNTTDSKKENRLKKWALNFLAFFIGLGFILLVLGVFEIYAQNQLKKTNEAFRKFYHPKSTAYDAGIGRTFVGGHYQADFILDALVGHKRDLERDPQIVGMTRKDIMPNRTVEHATIYFSHDNVDWHSDNKTTNSLVEFVPYLKRPIIVALGGSTTAAFEFPDESSWSEELARLLDENKLPGTVINFGNSSYKSSQEMLIFIRDVLQLKPDIVISYDGVNEVFGFLKDYPIYSGYTLLTYDYVVKNQDTFVCLPNTLFYLTKIIKHNKNKTQKVFYGVKSDRTADEVLLENWNIIKSICDSHNIRFYCVLQPFACNSEQTTTPELLQRHWKGKFGGDPKIRKDLIQMCNIVRKKMEQQNHFKDFTAIFDNNNSKDIFIWEDDTCHVSKMGNRIIARNMYQIIIEKPSEKTTEQVD
jgi:hypothetical protein